MYETTTTVVSPKVKPLYRSTQAVWYIFYAIETLLLFRFFLKLIGANTGAAFTQFIYGLSYPFVAPFLSVVGTPRFAGSVLDWNTLLAMLVYWILAWAIVRLIVMSKPISQSEAHQKLSQQDITKY